MVMDRTPQSRWSLLIGAALLLGCGSPPPLDAEVMGDTHTGPTAGGDVASTPTRTVESDATGPEDSVEQPDVTTEPDAAPEPDAGPELPGNTQAPSSFQATGFGGTSQAAGLTLRPLSMTTTGSSSTPDGALTLEALP